MHTHRHTQDTTHRHTGTRGHTRAYRHIHRHTQEHTEAYTDTQSNTQAQKQVHTHRHTGLLASSYETVCVCPISRLVLQPPSCRVSSLEAREPCSGSVSALCRVAGSLQKSITPKDHRVAAWTPEWPNTWITPKWGIPCKQPVYTPPAMTSHLLPTCWYTTALPDANPFLTFTALLSHMCLKWE